MVAVIRRKQKEVIFPPFEFSDMLDKPQPYGDWRDELATKGYYVVKGAVAKERALAIRDEIYDWMEAFPFGFKRDDPTTWKNEHMPIHIKGGMLHGYGIAHEDWIWKLRAEPGVIEAFAKLWGTDELVTSFDSASVMLPGRTDIAPEHSSRWQHIDQSPCRRGVYCIQGIMNLNECGPDDGGLLVMEGSSKLVETFFDEIGRGETRTWGPVDFYSFDEGQEQWFYDRGCRWVKVCCEPGDLILWDSRAMHHNCMPEKNGRDRVCTYITMAPAKLLNDDDFDKRKIAFEQYLGTTHVPFASIAVRPHEAGIRTESGLPDERDTGIPMKPRPPTDTILKLAGVKRY
ncbi:hypothetical protein T439DRAFT_328905 [Meredithblackwellia eburnea MCA 4105]